MLIFANAPFDLQNETLLPSAGACARCTKRTGNNPLFLPEERQKSIYMLSGMGFGDDSLADVCAIRAWNEGLRRRRPSV